MLPAANLLPVPDAVPDEAAVFTEPLAAAFEILEQLGALQGDGTVVRPALAGQRALVAGDGRLGLLCALALQEAGAEVSVAGRHPERLERLPFPLVARPGGLAEGRRAFDLAVEATGHPEVLPGLLAHVRPRGTIVLKTTAERPIELDLAPFVVDEITLLGSRCGPFAAALAWLERHPEVLPALVEARYPLAQADRALEHAGRGGVLKVLLEVG